MQLIGCCYWQRGGDINPWIYVPVGCFKTQHNLRTDRCYMTEPDEGINGRSLQWRRRKVLGGSSSSNGLPSVRGQAEDYGRLADELGNRGWAFDDVLSNYRKSDFTKSDPSVERPDIEFHMQPLSADKPGDGAHKFSAFTSSVCQLRPHSRSHMEIKASDPLEYPVIHPNHLSDERDHRVAVGGGKVARRIAEAPSLAPHIIDEYVPGRQFQSDEELLPAARQYSQTVYHPTSTCKMGHDEATVVDDLHRVHGIQTLRVAEASTMPEIVSGNANVPTTMIAEEAADMSREDSLA